MSRQKWFCACIVTPSRIPKNGKTQPHAARRWNLAPTGALVPRCPTCLGGPLQAQTLVDQWRSMQIMVLLDYRIPTHLSPSAQPLAWCRRLWKDSFGSSPPQDQIPPGDWSNAPRNGMIQGILAGGFNMFNHVLPCMMIPKGSKIWCPPTYLGNWWELQEMTLVFPSWKRSKELYISHFKKRNHPATEPLPNIAAFSMFPTTLWKTHTPMENSSIIKWRFQRGKSTDCN